MLSVVGRSRRRGFSQATVFVCWCAPLGHVWAKFGSAHKSIAAGGFCCLVCHKRCIELPPRFRNRLPGVFVESGYFCSGMYKSFSTRYLSVAILRPFWDPCFGTPPPPKGKNGEWDHFTRSYVQRRAHSEQCFTLSV